MPSGSKDVAVNDVIAFVAEEGDDLSDLPDPAEFRSSSEEKKEEKKERTTTTSQPPTESKGHAHFTKPAFPSVLRLAYQNGIAEPEKDIKGTGPHGMLTKGDVLAYLGKSHGAYGTSKPHHTTISQLGGSPTKGDRGSKEAAKAPPKVRARY